MMLPGIVPAPEARRKDGRRAVCQQPPENPSRLLEWRLVALVDDAQ